MNAFDKALTNYINIDQCVVPLSLVMKSSFYGWVLDNYKDFTVRFKSLSNTHTKSRNSRYIQSIT
jgi:hypothetical protein